MRDSYPTVRRYSPAFLNTLDLHAAPAAQPLMEAIDVRQINVNHARKLPMDVPTHFIKRR